MQWLIEINDNFSDYEIIKEESENKEERKFKIKGPFLVAEDANKNKRRYPKPLIERVTLNYTNEKIKKKIAYGELDHPKELTVSGKNAAIHTDSLVMDGNYSIGTATVLNTPNGRIIKSILNDGYSLGVSSRGVGTLRKDGWVNDDYKFLAEDVVTDPSGYSCYVQSILESKEFIISDDVIVERAVEHLQEQVDRKYDSKVLLAYYLEFLNNIRKGF